MAGRPAEGAYAEIFRQEIDGQTVERHFQRMGYEGRRYDDQQLAAGGNGERHQPRVEAAERLVVGDGGQGQEQDTSERNDEHTGPDVDRQCSKKRSRGRDDSLTRQFAGKFAWRRRPKNEVFVKPRLLAVDGIAWNLHAP